MTRSETLLARDTLALRSATTASCSAGYSGDGRYLTTLPVLDVELRFDPVQRQHQYAEQRAAAEDVAYIFFDLWQTRLDAWVEIEAAAFERSRSWERGLSMG